MGVSILFDTKKMIFYKGPKSLKNGSKTYVLTSGTLKKRFLAIFSCRMILELFFFIGFRPILSNFWHFQFFFPVCGSRRGLFFAKNSISRGKTLLFSMIHHFFAHFWAFLLIFLICPPLIRVSSGHVLMKQRPRTKSVRRQHGLGGGTL